MSAHSMIPVVLPRFQVGQALYSPTGLKIGWVESVSTADGSALVKLAVSNTGRSTSHSYVRRYIAELRNGTILTRADLDRKGIQRSSPPSLFRGNRLFQTHNGLFIGHITQISTSDTGTFVCHTDMGQVALGEQIIKGNIIVGRRNHEPQPTTK